MRDKQGIKVLKKKTQIENEAKLFRRSIIFVKESKKLRKGVDFLA